MLDRLVSVAKDGDWQETERLLYEHWTLECPPLFSPNTTAPWDIKLDESKINDVLLHPVTAAYCLDKEAGSDLKPLLVSCGLSQDGPGSGSMCGHVFNQGEATYSCKECASDPTCVMCYTCFNKSEHRYHKYRMAASGGSGYCDCGDVEAWKQHPCCQLHSANDLSRVEQLSTQVSDRVRALTRTILRYSTLMVCWPHSTHLPDCISELHADSALPQFQTILYNDETHTYDSVIRALNLSIHCNEQQAMLLATVVDREGRSSVRAGSSDFCTRAKDEIQRRTQKDTSRRTEKTGPLEVRVMDSRLIAVQNLAIRLLSWLVAQTHSFPPLAWSIGEVLLHDSVQTGDKDVILVHLMKCDRSLWKAARANFHQMLMATVLMNNEHKQLFSRLFVRLYKQVFFDYIDDDHEHAVSIVSLTVQVFTVPTIARMLIADESAIERVLEPLLEHCQTYLKPPDKHTFDFSSKSFPSVLRRALYTMYDHKYLLTVVPSQTEWTQPLRDSFIRGCSAYIKLLTFMQGMDEVKRESVEHQVWEFEWETAFNIQLNIQKVTTLLLAWACSDKQVHDTLMKLLMEHMIATCKSMVELDNKVTITVNGSSAQCIPFDVSKNKLSIHQPLWRLLAGLFTGPACEAQLYIHRRALLCEMPLRVLVLCAQSHAQMWRRNGFSLVNQIHNYLSPLCRTEMFDRDVLMVQVTAAISSPDVFIIRVLHRFGLHKWADLNYERASVSSQDELSKSIVLLAEEMLHLFISIMGERYVPGVGECTRQDMLRRDVLHVLATGPKPFSKIDRAIPSCPLLEKLSLDEAVKQVADFRKPTQTSAGLFTLKRSVLHEYNPYYYHYSKTDVSQAELYQHKERSLNDKSLLACAPPASPRFKPFFAPITQLLISPVLLNLLKLVVDRTNRKSRFSSESLLHRALYITAMGLVEQEQDTSLDFIVAAEAVGLFEQLQALSGKCELHNANQLLNWTLQRYKQMKNQGKDTANQGVIQPLSDTQRLATRAAIAAKKRKQAMEQMSRMQSKFITHNKDLLEADKKHDDNAPGRGFDEDEEPIGVLLDEQAFSVCLGKGRSEVGVVPYRRVTCILCQETQDVSWTGRAMVCVAYQQFSSLFTQRHSSLVQSRDILISANMSLGMDVSTCGHTLHFDCYQQYNDLLRNRERGRPRQQLLLSQRMVDVENNEYLCPLCKRLSNTVMPLLPALSTIDIPRFTSCTSASVEFDEWLCSMQAVLNEPLNNPTRVKTHTRKRSHSERSLLDMTKRGNEPNDSNLSTSVPSASALSLMIDNTSINNDSIPLSDSASGSGMAGSVQSVSERPDARLLSMLRPLQSLTVVHKIKEFMGQTKHQLDNVPVSLLSWDMIKCFIKSAHERFERSDGCTLFVSRKTIETVTTWQITAFALRSIAAVLRCENKPLFGAFNTRQRECLYNLSRVCAVSAFNTRPEQLRLVLGHILAPLLGTGVSVNNTAMPSPPTSPSHDSKLCSVYVDAVSRMHEPVNVLAVDTLSLSIELAMCIGWGWVDGRITIHNNNKSTDTHLLPDGSCYEQFAVQLTLIAHLYQIMASLDDNVDMDTSNKSDVDDALLERVSQLYSIVQHKHVTSSTVLVQLLEKGVIEMLRPLALFYHAITLVPPPEALKDPSLNEYAPLCRYLGLPHSLALLLQGSSVLSLFNQWTLQQNTIPVLHVITQPIFENRLVSLPDDFSDLVNQASNFKCPSIQMEEHASSVPTLCLVCGSLLCSQSYCCQRTINNETLGACSYHLHSCSGLSGGLFLRIRDSQVILLTSRARGCFHPAPYVDEFGETDFGFRRGNPLHLNRELYAKLQHLWLHQAVCEEVVNQYEIDHRNIAYEWQHF